MRGLQLAGLVLVVVGGLILFLLRGPLFTFLLVVADLIGIFVGFLLVVVGFALILGGRWARRRPRDSLAADPAWPNDR